MNIRSALLLLIVWTFVILVATSCSHTNPSDELIVANKLCTTQIELRNGTKFESPEDVDNMINAEEGCIKHYGQGSCLIRFIKTSKLSYYAICRRG
jgi:hypothetical protein